VGWGGGGALSPQGAGWIWRVVNAPNVSGRWCHPRTRCYSVGPCRRTSRMGACVSGVVWGWLCGCVVWCEVAEPVLGVHWNGLGLVGQPKSDGLHLGLMPSTLHCVCVVHSARVGRWYSASVVVADPCCNLSVFLSTHPLPQPHRIPCPPLPPRPVLPPLPPPPPPHSHYHPQLLPSSTPSVTSKRRWMWGRAVVLAAARPPPPPP
jgi:hypothetical protein